MIYRNIEEFIGNTPLIELANYERNHRLHARIVAKFEAMNPAGSIKDRAALSMIQAGFANGSITDGTVLIEPTSGNTGIGLAALCASRGLRLIITMPDTMSAERIKLMRAYGAEVVLTPGSEGMAGAVAAAERLAASMPDAIIPGQFDNPANPSAHYHSTGPEIWRDAEGHVDAFVAGVGTGGTFTGTVRYLKEQNPQLLAIAVEPAGSPLLSEEKAGAHDLQGIGANFVPSILDRALIDEIVTISDEEAYAAARELAAREGLLAGITSGANVAAAEKLALRPEFEGRTIATVLPDTGERYLSSRLFDM